jgi:hypothetical protein
MLLFGAAALLFAVGARPLRPAGARISTRPAAVPHGRGGTFAACGDCHQAAGGAPILPATHRHFPVATCGTCHPPTIPGA